MTNNKPPVSGSLYLLRTIPNIQRARGYRLYLANGKRLTDLWLNGGAAILGHTPANLLHEIKNTASRGLYAPYPHFTKNRFLKALSALFPGRSFRLYAAPPQELMLSTLSGLTQVNEEKKERAFINFKLWRPYCDPANPFAVDDTQILIPVLQGIQTWRNNMPLGLCAAVIKNEPADSDESDIKLPPDDDLPPILTAIAARGIYDLLAAPARGKPNLPKVSGALHKSRWRRMGIYLTLKKEISNEEWEVLFHKFLDAGFLLPPFQSQPAILPGELSDGEEKKLAAALSY